MKDDICTQATETDYRNATFDFIHAGARWVTTDVIPKT